MRWERKVQTVSIMEEPSKPKPLFGQLAEEIEKGKPRWTYLVPSVATLIGTVVTLLSTTATIIILALTLNQNNDKNRVERKENAIRRLETQFSEVQTRLSNSDPQTRAVAALQLADLAQTPLPAEALTPEEEKAGFKITDFSRLHYPFFLRAVRQYATILPMEKEASVRAATKDAVFLLVKFLRKYIPSSTTTLSLKVLLAPEYEGKLVSEHEGKDGGNKRREITEADVALVELTNEIADANRKAMDNFIYAFANYTTENPSRTDEILVAATNFCGTTPERRNITKIALNAMEHTATFITQQKLHSTRLKLLSSTQQHRVKDTISLDSLEREAQKLIDIRDALAITLTGYIASGRQDEALFDNVSTLPKKRLRNCFLVGANLREVYLAEADLYGTQLQGAYLTSARFQQAELKNARLQEADMQGARLQKARLSEAKLQGANLKGADLQEACLGSREQFKGASLDNARLQGANFTEANLKGVSLKMTRFNDKTCLYGIMVLEKDEENFPRTNFKGANWWDADFKPKEKSLQSVAADKRTNDVKAWLQENFPKPQKPMP